MATKTKTVAEVVPVAKFGSPDKPLLFEGVQVPCYVLDDGRRVLTLNGMISALGLSKGTWKGTGEGLNRIARFSSGNAVRQHIPEGVRHIVATPVQFSLPNSGGIAYGFDATVLPKLCRAVLAARQSRSLRADQQRIADRCEQIVIACSEIGIVALIDEATGYQTSRADDALQTILGMYLTPVRSTWAKRFPDEFYRHIFRLRGWQWKGRSTNCPQCVAHYTNDLIYERLAPGILEELEKINPQTDTRARNAAHHQFLTSDVGHPALDSHMQQIITLQKATDSWDRFMQTVNTVFPKKPHTLERSLFE